MKDKKISFEQCCKLYEEIKIEAEDLFPKIIKFQSKLNKFYAYMRWEFSSEDKCKINRYREMYHLVSAINMYELFEHIDKRMLNRIIGN